MKKWVTLFLLGVLLVTGSSQSRAHVVRIEKAHENYSNISYKYLAIVELGQ